jgi:hypothetical protein
MAWFLFFEPPAISSFTKFRPLYLFAWFDEKRYVNIYSSNIEKCWEHSAFIYFVNGATYPYCYYGYGGP